MNEFVFSDQAVAFVTSAPPQGIELLTPAKCQANGIGYKSIRNALRQAHTQKQDTNFDRTGVGISEEPYDPLRAVQKFYVVLAKADGSAAAKLVIPDKRCKGLFNEQDQIEIAAGHYRIEAAIKCGIKQAEVFVVDIDKKAMICIYARENATQRGNHSTAAAGSVAAAIRFISKE